MIIEAEATINTVIKLAIVEDDLNAKTTDVTSMKTHYINQLECV